MEVMEPIAAREGAGGIVAPEISQKEMRQKGLLQLSDAEGLAQLLFHVGVLGACGVVVMWAYHRSYWALLLLAELPFGVVESFLFNGFHEMVHNTAFESRWLNTCLAHVLGFESFRGAKWFWCFHWTHHRFTNDPSKDPELSGGVDTDDPTQSMSHYLRFLSGYPFGFERLAVMARSALLDQQDVWVREKPPKVQLMVRAESLLYLLGYGLIACCSLLWPSLGVKVLLLWILPHCIGAGHLRLYQFAEHRACTMGPYTDTNAWVCARTTYTWWLYRKLAWYMPYHVEHHAWPNVPFHKLEAAHALVKEAYKKQGLDKVPSGCSPSGEVGYLGLHWVSIKTILNRKAS